MSDEKDEEPAARGLRSQLSTVEKVIGVLVAAGLGYTGVMTHFIQNRVTEQTAVLGELEKKQDIEINLRKDTREAAKQNNELTKTIFDEFVKAITDQVGEPTQRVDRLAAVLVLTYAISDARQQEGMARAVQQAIERVTLPNDSSGYARLAAAKFDAEQLVVRAVSEQKIELAAASGSGSKTHAAAPVSPPPGEQRWTNYDFDVFYCETGADAARLKAQADDVLALRAADPKASGRWRARPLPASVQERPGYEAKGYEVHYSSADEKPLADALAKLMRERLNVATVEVVSTPQSTPWYLSVFLCPRG